MKYAAMYKCPLCGELKQYGETPESNKEPTDEQLNVFMGGLVKKMGAIRYPLNVWHKCADGSRGFAAFAGFRRMDETKPP